jgi:regulator of chromosome condensation (RCC1) repeat-containing protein/Big-like domain-containing protein/Regulator of Chromosome Condensation (RCC1) repeat protein
MRSAIGARAVRPLLSCGLLYAILACGGAAASDGVTTPPPAATVASIKLNYTTASVARGQTLRLTATPVDATGATVAGKTVLWTVDNSTTVSVDGSGTVTGNAGGSAVVTASVDGKTATTLVSVIAFSAIQPGMLNTCALSSVGRLYCAGTTNGALAKPEGGSLRFASLTSHSEPEGSNVAHFCALTSDGTAYCWGTNGYGELGVGDTIPHATPTAVIGGLKFQSLTAGQHHTCGLTLAGDAYCWGADDSGQLGNGTTTSSSQPIPLLAAPRFVSIESGHFFTCALTADGVAWCWGRNNLGQLGSGDVSAFRATAAPIGGATRFKSLGSKWTSTCALTADGAAYCWGDNTLGQVGSVTTSTCEGDKPCALQPTAAAPGLSFSSIAASQFSTCAIAVDKQVWCWGGNMQNQFGSASPPASCSVAGFAFGCTTVPVRGPAGFSVIRGSPRSYCGISSTDGVAYCWGGNDQKQLGNPTVTDMTSTPVVFSIDPLS